MARGARRRRRRHHRRRARSFEATRQRGAATASRRRAAAFTGLRGRSQRTQRRRGRSRQSPPSALRRSTSSSTTRARSPARPALEHDDRGLGSRARRQPDRPVPARRESSAAGWSSAAPARSSSPRRCSASRAASSCRATRPSKSGVAGLVRALANEWAPHGVNVNAIAPGLHRDRQHRGAARGRQIAAARSSTGSRLVDGARRPTSAAPRSSSPRRRPTTCTERSSRSTADGWRVERQRVLELLCAQRRHPRRRRRWTPSMRAALGAALKARRPAGRRGDVSQREARFVLLRTLAADADLLVGAGTVIRPEQVDLARDAGAASSSRPGFSPHVVERCRRARACR